ATRGNRSLRPEEPPSSPLTRLLLVTPLPIGGTSDRLFWSITDGAGSTTGVLRTTFFSSMRGIAEGLLAATILDAASDFDSEIDAPWPVLSTNTGATPTVVARTARVNP